MSVIRGRLLFSIFLFGVVTSCTEDVQRPQLKESSTSRISRLKTAVSIAPTTAEKFKLIEELRYQVKKEASDPLSQAPENEIDLLVLKEGLDLVPPLGDFEPTQCESYKTKLNAQLDPQGVDPTVQKILEVLTVLCE